jgi:hypothetical protein
MLREFFWEEAMFGWIVRGASMGFPNRGKPSRTRRTHPETLAVGIGYRGLGEGGSELRAES